MSLFRWLKKIKAPTKKVRVCFFGIFKPGGDIWTGISGHTNLGLMVFWWAFWTVFWWFAGGMMIFVLLLLMVILLWWIIAIKPCFLVLFFLPCFWLKKAYNGSYEHHHKIMITTYDGPVGWWSKCMGHLSRFEVGRYFGALMAIAMMLSNLGTIVINDSHYLISAGHVENVTAVADSEKGYSLLGGSFVFLVWLDLW